MQDVQSKSLMAFFLCVQCALKDVPFMWLGSSLCLLVVAPFLKSYSRGHQSVFPITTCDVSWPGCAPRNQTHVHCHVCLMRFLRHRGNFFLFAHLRQRARLGHMTPRRRRFFLLLFSFSQHAHGHKCSHYFPVFWFTSNTQL